MIQLQPELEAELASEAQARGLALDWYVEQIVRARSLEYVHHRTIAEAIDGIRELRKGNILGGLRIKE